MFFSKKCPRCGSKNIGKVEESFGKKLSRFAFNCIFWIGFLFNRGQKPLNVCRDCGFSWESR